MYVTQRMSGRKVRNRSLVRCADLTTNSCLDRQIVVEGSNQFTIKISDDCLLPFVLEQLASKRGESWLCAVEQ